MSWAEADSVVDDLTEVINRKSGGAKSIIYCKAEDPDLIGENVSAVYKFLIYQGTLDENLEAKIEVPYAGTYQVTCGTGITQKAVVPQLGEIVDVDLLPYHLYGAKIRKADSNSSARVEYTDMAAGFTPLTRDFAMDETDLGDWGDTFLIKKIRPVMLQANGEVAYELDHNDQTKRIDGVTPSEISAANTTLNAMVEIGTMWAKRWQDGNFRYIQLADARVDSDFKAYAHTADDGITILDNVYYNMFEGSSVNSKVRSIAGQAPMNTQTGATEQTQIQANGAGWQFGDMSTIELLRDILTLLGKSTNSQAVYGRGHDTGGSSASSLLTTGTKKDKGMFSCTNSNDAVKVLWIENFWGDRWDRTYGAVYTKTGKLMIKPNPPYNTTGLGYTDTGITFSGTSGGYINETKTTEYGTFPVKASGSETTYECDGLWWATADPGFLSFGGSCYIGGSCGFACWDLFDPFSHSYWDDGPSLSYKKPVAA